MTATPGKTAGAPGADPDTAAPGPRERRAGEPLRWLGRGRRAALAPFSGALLALSFPDAPRLWPLALLGPFALGVMFALFASAAPRRAALEGYVAVGVFFGVLLRWFAVVLLDFTDLGHVVAFGAPVASGLIEGVLGACLAWTIARLAWRFGTGPALAAAPFLWVGYDVLRGVFPVPFPWGTLAAAWSVVPGVPAVAAVAGAHGVSLTLAAGAALGAAWWLSPGRRRPVAAGIVVWAGLALALVVAGREAQDRLPPAPPLRLAVVQGALPFRGDPLAELETYEELTERAARAGAKAVVWPESAVAYRLDTMPTYRARVEMLATRFGVDMVLGSVTARPGGGIYNSVAIVRPDGGLSGIQPKRQLVPFGEYLPARFLFGNVPAIAVQLGEDFTPGERPVVLAGAHAGYGALVCFEGVFPQLSKGLAEAGAGVLVNTTNDSWFGWSPGVTQHLAHTTLRAAETGRPLLRAANTGISVLVDRTGETVRRLELGERGLLVADLVPGTAVPPGARAGWVTGWACAIVSLAAILAAFVFRSGARDA